MTLCIAAIAREKAIIAVSDMRFDLGYTSGDGLPKMGRLNRFWSAMFAGQDAGNAPALLANISDAMAGASDVTRKHVERLFRDEYRAALEERIESSVLSPFRLTVKEFTKTGPKRFTPDVFAQLCAQMAATEVPYEFLVFGFDEKRKPHLFRVHKGGQIDDCRAIGFWAIGSGDLAAVHHMFFHDFKTDLPLRTTAYYACAAKYFAERASLGERTYVRCLMSDGRLIGIDESEIRKLWDRKGRSRVPEDIWDLMPAFYNLNGRGRPTDDVKTPTPAGRGEVVGDWISSAIDLAATPLALRMSEKKKEEK